MNGRNRLVWALTEDGFVRMTLKRAQELDFYIALCGKCDDYAWALDHLAPYHQDMNRCKKHSGGAS